VSRRFFRLVRRFEEWRARAQKPPGRGKAPRPPAELNPTKRG